MKESATLKIYEKRKGLKTGPVSQSQIGFWSTKEFRTLKKGSRGAGDSTIRNGKPLLLLPRSNPLTLEVDLACKDEPGD